MLPKKIRSALRTLASPELTVAALAALMVLVTACTLAQTRLGNFDAVKVYIRSAFIWWEPARSSWRVPFSREELRSAFCC